jgi:hypothetical protein
MSQVEELWERLVEATLRNARKSIRDIEEILTVVEDEIQGDDPTVSRICMFYR